MTPRTSWRETASRALREALRIRRDAGIGLPEALSVFDLVEGLGLELRFVDVGSLEGMYWSGDTPRIFISAHRPPGRQVFTCGHELGHHIFAHGTRLDEFVSGATHPRRRQPEEMLADTFSGFLLMPKGAVTKGFSSRGWDPRNLRPQEYYVVATWLGVGYTTLLTHMAHSLHMISDSQATRLAKVPVRDIRRTLAGRDVTGDLVVVDPAWTGRPVDLRVGDWLLLPPNIEVESSQLRVKGENAAGLLLTATAQGCGRLHNPVTDQALFLRVSRNQYVGLGKYRHLEDPDDG